MESGFFYLVFFWSLCELNFCFCEGIGDDGIVYLVVGGFNLICLDVSFCDKVGDVVFNYILNGFYYLKNLGLNFCYIIDEGLCKVV